MVITKEQHNELKQLKNKLAALLLEIDNNKIEDLLTIDEVFNFTCEFFDVEADELKADNRTKEFVLYRSFFIKFAHQEMKSPYQKIAEFLNKNHSTLLNNMKKLNEVFDNHPEIKKQYEQYKIDLL
jgi:chromosomal replication initiation ATPase DnaA